MNNRVNCGKATVVKMATTPIRSQASNVAARAVRVEEGSETRSRAKAVTDPRVPGSSWS